MKHPKRPADVNQLAKHLVDEATGELPEEPPESAKAKAGRKGGQARAERLTAEERSESARKAAATRWGEK